MSAIPTEFLCDDSPWRLLVARITTETAFPHSAIRTKPGVSEDDAVRVRLAAICALYSVPSGADGQPPTDRCARVAWLLSQSFELVEVTR